MVMTRGLHMSLRKCLTWSKGIKMSANDKGGKAAKSNIFVNNCSSDVEGWRPLRWKAAYNRRRVCGVPYWVACRPVPADEPSQGRNLKR